MFRRLNLCSGFHSFRFFQVSNIVLVESESELRRFQLQHCITKLPASA